MSAIISKKDEGALLLLFNRAGYVLDFSTSSFDTFTMNSIGEALCYKYGMSKGKSLIAYLNEATDVNRTKLLKDLFEYYEGNMEYEYNEAYIDESWLHRKSGYNEKYRKLYLKCKKIIERLDNVPPTVGMAVEGLKTKFSSEYLSAQIDMMIDLQTTHPTDAIGKSKELIESCCKTVLDDMGIAWGKNDTISQLTNKVMNSLNLLPINVKDTDCGACSIRAILGSLRAIPIQLAELRNSFGSGHGKGASFQELESRHAKLAVGCSIAFVDFIWNTYENRKRI